MEKFFLITLVSAFVGFITAVLSVVKLVNEKENKTSEFRQEWTNSVRSVLSDLAEKITGVTASLEFQYRLKDVERKLAKRSAENTKWIEMAHVTMQRVGQEVSKNRNEMYQCFALCKLHFKPNEEKFQPIERLFDEIVENNILMKEKKTNEERNILKKANYKKINEITEIGRGILKDEWERVKAGEKAFQLTKAWSLYGGITMLVLIIVSGGYSISLLSNDSEKTLDIKAANINQMSGKTDKCWSIVSYEKKLYKMNSCSGQIVEIHLSLPSTLNNSAQPATGSK